jgi:hypothetical protein
MLSPEFLSGGITRTKRRTDGLSTANSQGRKLDKTGWMDQDASGSGNVFPTLPKTFLRSATSEQAASTGIGGLQGALILAAVIGVVALSTVPVVRQETGETLTVVADSYSGDSLSTISQRIGASI